MQTGDLANWLGCSESTIKNYTRWYKDFLEPSARGGGGSRRHFSDTDSRIVAHIFILFREGRSREEITAALLTLQADDWRDLPEMPVTEDPTQAPIDLMPRETHETAIRIQQTALMREVSVLQENTERLTLELSSERDAHEETRSEVVRLTMELGQALGQLSTQRMLVIILVVVSILALGATLLLIFR